MKKLFGLGLIGFTSILMTSCDDEESSKDSDSSLLKTAIYNHINDLNFEAYYTATGSDGEIDSSRTYYRDSDTMLHINNTFEYSNIYTIRSLDTCEYARGAYRSAYYTPEGSSGATFEGGGSASIYTPESLMLYGDYLLMYIYTNFEDLYVVDGDEEGYFNIKTQYGSWANSITFKDEVLFTSFSGTTQVARFNIKIDNGRVIEYYYGDHVNSESSNVFKWEISAFGEQELTPYDVIYEFWPDRFDPELATEPTNCEIRPF